MCKSSIAAARHAAAGAAEFLRGARKSRAARRHGTGEFRKRFDAAALRALRRPQQLTSGGRLNQLSVLEALL